MRDIWKILLKILLSISICIVAIFVFVWAKKYFSKISKSDSEGFQSLSLVTLGRGKYDGTPMNSATLKENPSSVDTEFIIIKINSGTEFNNFSFKQPVQIFEGTTKVADATLFAYNKPSFLIIKSINAIKWKTTGTGVKWTASGAELAKATEYTIQSLFCDIPGNKIETTCLTPNVDTFPVETAVEQNIYDTYEMYNIENPPPPSYTQMEPYDMASELSEFDVGATIPWDYDNRIFQPNDVLWGNIHPNVSQSIFNTAYTRDVLKSINNLEYDESNKAWTYKSLVFERTWSGDEKRFLPGIQFAEFLVETGIGIVVEGAYSGAEDRIMTRTAWGKAQTAILDSSDEASRMKNTSYIAAIKNNMTKSQATAYSKAYAAQYYNDRFIINSLPDDEKAQCDTERQRILDSGEGAQKNKANLAKLTEANDAARAKADTIIKSKTVLSAIDKTPAQINTQIDEAGTAKPSGIEARLTRSNIPDPKLKVKGVESRGIGSIILRILGLKGSQKLAGVVAGKTAVKLARAIGATMASKGLLYGVASAICGPTAAFTAGASCAILYTTVTVLNIFIDFFVLSCCTFIPAILAAYIPEDALCPPGYFNIRDAMIALPGGEVGWQIVSAIPGFGDSLGTFGPYLCSKVENGMLTECVLKTPPVTPGYFYDSTLSIFCDTNKAPMRSDIAQFRDSRRYTINGAIAPKWSDSEIPPIWVDFADKDMLNKMAQFYYTYSRRLAINNYDGTHSFEYISKFYGVIASSLYSCDVQCEITRVSYYESTGVEQCKYVVPVDPANGTTYHDRRFYFYPIQVPDTSKSDTDPARISAEKIQTMYRPKLGNYDFLTWNVRKTYVKGNDSQLNDLMNDNQMRYIVTACTNSDGTAPNAYEYNAEGDYVGDALISLGDGNSSADTTNPNLLYYPPAVSVNNSMYTELTSAYTIISENLGTINSETVLTYNNPLVTFIKPFRDRTGTLFTGDTIKGVQIDDSNVKQNTDKFFTGTVTDYQSGPPQRVTINITANTISEGPKKYSLEITARSNTVNAPTNDNDCTALRNKAYKYGQTIRNNDDPNAGGNTPSFTITTRDFRPLPWKSFDRSTNASDYRTGFNTAKIWNEKYEGQIVSQSAIDKSIVQGTAMGYIGFRVNWGMVPVGAIITGGIMNTNFEPEWSIASLIACSYQDTLRSYGTYVLNGNITTIHEGTNNRYLIIERGPIVPFASGYTPTINKRIVQLSQYDCINRNAIRRVVKTYNTRYTGEQVSKVFRIETDNSNKKCLYMFETVPYDSVRNVRNLSSKLNKIVTVGYNYSSTDYALIQGTTLNTATLNIDGTHSPSLPDFILSIAPTSFETGNDIWGELNINIPTSGFIPVTAPTATESVPATKNLTRPGSSDTNKYTCASPNIYNRLITQFNIKHKLNPQITSIINSYVPSSGTKNDDGTFTCIYNANVKAMNTDTAAYETRVRTITMTLVPANDPARALYDLLKDNYPTAYLYKEVPKPNQWIDVPAPLIPEKSISRNLATCGSLSTCEDLSLISNLVNKFNNQMINGKIMKVRKAYTPLVTSNVCDFEVEMLRVIEGTSESIIQKESIRLPIKANATDPCMWDLDMLETETSIPIPDTGISLTNSASVALLPNPYIWAPSYLTLIRNSINDALLNYLNIDIKNIISNATVSVNRKVNRVYETILTAQILTHPNPTCKLRCNDSNVIQSIINRYNADNYPITQYGVQKARMVEIRRIGTYTSNQCQVEFIERVDTYKNFISSITFSSDASNPDAKFNTKYYLRQYQFDMVPDQAECAHNMVPIANLVATNTINSLDISGNGLAIMSDSSVIPKAQSDGFYYDGKNIDCTNTRILDAVKSKYRATARFLTTDNYNEIQQFTTAFNQRANVCEYNVKTKRWFKARNNRYYTLDNQVVTIEAQWNSYNFRTGISNYLTAPSSVVEPDIVREYDPASITMKLDTNGAYQAYNTANNQISLPFTYQVPSNYDRTRVSPLSYP